MVPAAGLTEVTVFSVECADVVFGADPPSSHTGLLWADGFVVHMSDGIELETALLAFAESSASSDFEQCPCSDDSERLRFAYLFSCIHADLAGACIYSHDFAACNSNCSRKETDRGISSSEGF